MEQTYILWIAIGLVLVAVLLLYLLGRAIAPRNPNDQKCASYACGEEMSGAKAQFYPNTFIYAIYFTIFDILAFILATAMGTISQATNGTIGFSVVAAVFAGIGLLGVITLRR